MAAKRKVDRSFLIVSILLVVGGFFIFSSASLGLLTKGSSIFQAVTFNQVVLGLIGGTIAAVVASKIPYPFIRKNAFYIYIGAIVIMCLIFVPGLGMFHGGAKRWISIAGFSFQPAEIYKIAFVVYLAAWLASVKQKVSTFKFGTLPLLILFTITAGLILTQPDTDTFMIIILSGFAMFFVAGGNIKHMLVIGLIGIMGLTVLVYERPYLMKRINTFFDPTADSTGSGYQIQQSLIAIGSGGITGRGFGQSIQKFNFLPEPIGDSIFAVAGEEFGLIGSSLIVFLYLLFAIRGYKIATRTPDSFSGLVVIGLISLIVLQSFLNIAAMLAIIPLSGTPLLFISHGGTALFFSLLSVGIILGISKYKKAS